MGGCGGLDHTFALGTSLTGSDDLGGDDGDEGEPELDPDARGCDVLACAGVFLPLGLSEPWILESTLPTELVEPPSGE